MTREEAKKRLEVWLICGECPEDKQCYDSHLHSTCEYTDYCDEVSLTDAVKVAISALSENKGDLISRQAVLDLFHIKYSDKELYKAIYELPSVENKGEWIPVSERLPKIADVYRVTRYYPNNVMNPKYLVDACAFDGSNTWYNDNRINHDRAYVDNVIAWQENPEPYKAEKPETCKGCLEPCIMYEPDMRACKKKVREVSE